MKIANSHEKVLSVVNDQVNANQTTVRYHLIPVRMAIIKKKKNKKTKTQITNVGKDVEKGEQCTLLVEM